ncbi:MAG TPA: DUF2088 domain-containing protein [Chloroflexota bacterium]|nr:DUF2088 domain-containing protein [Chloroflexota bacterium]
MAILSPPDLGAELGLTFPTMYAGQRVYRPEEVPEIPLDRLRDEVRTALQVPYGRITRAGRVAITAGSRGVANIGPILRTCGEVVREAGGEPFVMPAMGSHGGATAEGQRDVLAGYGLTREALDMPIVSSMEVQQIGQVGEMPVYMSTTALEADNILLVNRVKPHTDFRGEVESGLAKICAIGLGKQRGAQTIHSYGTRGLAELMPQAARLMIDTTGRFLGGLAVLENAYDRTACVEFVEPGEIGLSSEVALQRRARELMAKLPFSELDVLLVDEMGKNISGTGMDTNVLGRMYVPGVPEADSPRITAVVVLDLTEESHGNATGIGLADFTTERVLGKVDLYSTYMNGYTSATGGLLRNRLPNILPTDRAAIATAMRMCGKPDPSTVRLARIKNTLLASYVEFSANLLPEAAGANVEVTSEPRPMSFSPDGRLQA